MNREERFSTSDELGPTPYVPPALAPRKPGTWLRRSLAALFQEHTLPYRVRRGLDYACRLVGLTHRTVRLNGLEIRLRRLSHDENFVQNLVVNEEYNPAGYEIGERDTVIDIGANIGVFSLLAARKAPRGRVFAFEPIEANFKMLTSNLRRNKITNVTARKAAILDARSVIKIYWSHEPERTGCPSVFVRRQNDPRHFEESDAIPLSSVFDDYQIERCHFLKIDCEGAEYQILHALPMNYFQRIDKIVMEYHTTTVSGDDLPAKSNKLVNHLQQAGFRIDAYVSFGTGGFIHARRG